MSDQPKMRTVSLTLYTEMSEEDIQLLDGAEIKALFEEELRNYHPEVVIADMEVVPEHEE